MQLGSFSVSLTVADMAASKQFYANLGFENFGGDGESWTILTNGTEVIGLFKGMFDSNILTFNPGWTGLAEPVSDFTDVRSLREELAGKGIETLEDTTGDSAEGPASFKIKDPDGNVILFDQHV